MCALRLPSRRPRRTIFITWWALNSINAAVMDFHDVHAKLKQGAQFYGDLRQRADQLRQTISGHVHGRALQAREMLLNIKRQSEATAQVHNDHTYAMGLAAPPPAVRST